MDLVCAWCVLASSADARRAATIVDGTALCIQHARVVLAGKAVLVPVLPPAEGARDAPPA